MAKKERDEFSVEWEGNYKTKLDYLDELSKERLSWLASFNFGSDGDGEGDPSSSGSAAGLTPGTTYEEKAWNFFAGKGFTAAAAAGVLGNLKQESGIDPKKKQYGGGPGRGLCQWEKGARWDSLVSWAKESNLDEWDLDTQLEFLWLELNGRDSYTKTLLDRNWGGIEGLKNATDYKWACDAFEKSFERAGKPNMPQRYKFAADFLDRFAKGNGSGVAGLVGAADVAAGALPGGLKAAKMISGKVIPPSGSAYSSTIAKARRSAGFNNYATLESSKYYSNLSGCTMMVAPEFKPFVDLIHENFRAKNLLKNGKIAINSAFRVKDPEGTGYDNNAHGWGGAIDIGVFGIKDALAKADICWALGFRNVQIGGALKSGGGFIHVDIAPDLGGWQYKPWPTYRGPTSWKQYR